MCKIRISHKNKINKALFPSHVSREENLHFLRNWRKISVLKMEVGATREATVAVFSYIINDLHLKAHRRNAVNKHCHVILHSGTIVFGNTIV